MLSIFVIFIASCLVSFIGSLQLGPVNLFVINSALYNRKSVAFLIAIGGSLPEFIYCALAVFANNYLLEYSWLIFSFKIAFIIILFIVGAAFLFKKKSTVTIEKSSNEIKNMAQHILKGFSLAALNPQLLPFWIFVQVYFNSIKFLQIQSNLDKLSYILGAGIGAFILLASLIQIVSKHKETFLKYLNNKYYFKALSLLFFAIAIQQTWLLLQER